MTAPVLVFTYLQDLQSEHLPLQQVWQSLQQVEHFEPAAWTEPSAAANANATAMIMDFIIFLSFGNFEMVNVREIFADPALDLGDASRRWSRRRVDQKRCGFVFNNPS